MPRRAPPPLPALRPRRQRSRHGEDEAGFEATCVQGRRLGFDGRSLIHPRQIPACNRIFSPSVDDVRAARRTVDAWERATAQGLGVAVIDGRLVEKLHVEEASRLLALDQAIRAREE